MDLGLSPGRYFLALWPPDPVRELIAQHASDWLRPASRRYRPVRRERYHLTLSFLGELDRPATQRLETGLLSLRAWAGSPFRLLLDRVGHFGGEAAWLGCQQPPPELMALHEGLSRAMRQAGIERVPTRPWVPHVTIARGMHGSWPTPLPGGVPVAWDVREWVLVRSLPSPDHAYRIVARQALGAR